MALPRLEATYRFKQGTITATVRPTSAFAQPQNGFQKSWAPFEGLGKPQRSPNPKTASKCPGRHLGVRQTSRLPNKNGFQKSWAPFEGLGKRRRLPNPKTASKSPGRNLWFQKKRNCQGSKKLIVQKKRNCNYPRGSAKAVRNCNCPGGAFQADTSFQVALSTKTIPVGCVSKSWRPGFP